MDFEGARKSLNCPAHQTLCNSIVDAIQAGSKRIMLVGPSGSGKSYIAKLIFSAFKLDFRVVTSEIGYDIHERESIYQLGENLANQYILLEELSDFSMTTTSRDRRLTCALANMLYYPDLIIATTRDKSLVDPSLLKVFPTEFVIKPPTIDERRAFLESIYSEDSSCPPLSAQLHNTTDVEKQNFLLRQFAGLHVADLLSSKPLEEKPLFSNIAGASKYMKQLEFLVLKPLTDREAFKRVGVLPPRGVLLVGQSGVGKTLMARSIGRASRVSFFDITCTEIIAPEVGESERRLHSIFERARSSAPALILFDDIDAIAPPRTFGASLNEAADRLLTTLLVETDGLAGRDDGVVVMATTSRLSALDSAITRPGRFDYIIDIGLPDEKERMEMFELFTKGIPLENTEEIAKIVVDGTKGRTGADIEGVVREAAMIELRKSMDSKIITVESFKEALEPYKIKDTIKKNAQLSFKKPKAAPAKKGKMHFIK